MLAIKWLISLCGPRNEYRKTFWTQNAAINYFFLANINTHWDLGKIFGKKSGLDGLTLKKNRVVKVNHADRLRSLFGIKKPAKTRSAFDIYKDKDRCENRCLVHPTNRYSCGKSRSRETCSESACCWDASSQMCFKQVCK